MIRHNYEAEDNLEYLPSYEQKRKMELLQSVVTTLQQRGVKFAVAGGYGLDALYGELTRNHKDYDFVVFDESEKDFQEIISGLGFDYNTTKESGTVVFNHAEKGTELEYLPVSKIQELLQKVKGVDGDLKLSNLLTEGDLGDTTIPTFNIEAYKIFDSFQNKRFGSSDPHMAHKQKIYKEIEENMLQDGE